MNHTVDGKFSNLPYLHFQLEMEDEDVIEVLQEQTGGM